MHDEIAEFLRYWVGIRGSGELPSRVQVDPLTIPRRLLPKVNLMTFDEARGDFFYVLVGSLAHDVRGKEISGTCVADLPNRINGSREAYAEHIRELYRSAGRFRKPVHSRGTYRWSDWRPEITTERLTCPILGRDGQTVEYVGCQVFEGRSGSGLGRIDDADDYVPVFVRVLDDPDAPVA
ncbi:PAS domain-containing protein [Thalassobaculum sp.]|uniref:PAS domain-containing protein n=1 Tax=Thalassobaculum sp. TaxID=2022740 RepID=UPI0032EF85A1